MTTRNGWLGTALVGALVLATAWTTRAHAQAPERHVDDSSIAVSLWTTTGSGSTPGYRFRVQLRVYGEGLSSHDAVRIEYKQGGNVLATLRCPVSMDSALRGAVLLDQDQCRWEEGVLTATGDVEMTLTYQDDNTDSMIPLRSLAMRVGRFWSWSGMEGGRPTHSVQYQIMADDMLTAGTVELRAPSGVDTYGRVWLHFWAAVRDENWMRDPALRGAVDGQRLPDLTGNIQSSNASLSAEDRQFVDGSQEQTTHYFWTRFWVAAMLWHGQRDSGTDPNAVFVNEHPGQWSCQIRSEGATVRELRFVVGADGQIVRHAEQTDPAGIWLPPNVFLADVRFPSPNTFDFSFQPTVLRQRGFWGHAWAQPQAFAAEMAAMPAAAAR
ncbi:MAG: hypothetical protein K1X94_26175, partial [Sandaracinaceae bacterium]|nr:hypothetical protein [Sandaracinaceae bacterium]